VTELEIVTFAEPSSHRAIARLFAGRKRLWTSIFILTLTSVEPASAQSPFQDLSFESASIVPANSGDSDNIKAAPALPGWTVYYGATPQGTIDYDEASVGYANVSLFSSSCRQGAPFGLIQGRYYVLLQEGLFGSSRPGDPPPWATASIAQTGLVPITATGLTFRASIAQITVSLGGTMLPLDVLDSGQGYATYECDVSQFAGQTAQLKFTAGDPTVYLDDICFSSAPVAPVPEPVGLALFALGGTLLWWRRGVRRNAR
jgi:hypothetical protein